MTITLKSEQEQVLIEAVKSGPMMLSIRLWNLKNRLPHKGAPDESVPCRCPPACDIRQTSWAFLGGLTIKELFRESSP
jgi:hypothetical protein